MKASRKRRRCRNVRPVVLGYEPLCDGANLERFLSELVKWTLAGRIQSRVAAACRGIVETWLHAEDLPEVLKKMESIEQDLEAFKKRNSEPAGMSREDVIADFLGDLPAGLKDPIDEYIKHQAELEQKANADKAEGEPQS